MCALVSLSIIAPYHKRILRRTNSLTNSTGRHKAHMRVYEFGSVYVTCSSCRLVYFCTCTQFDLRDLASVCACICVRSCMGGGASLLNGRVKSVTDGEQKHLYDL